jgi:pyrimidine operon attenuation protein/uracil phosphoribosyltransferase
LIFSKPYYWYSAKRIALSDRIISEIKKEDHIEFDYGKLDITFYRDDVRNEIHVPNQTDIPFSIEGKK